MTRAALAARYRDGRPLGGVSDANKLLPLVWNRAVMHEHAKELEQAQELYLVVLGLHPVVIFQYSSTTLYQVSYHTR